MSLLFLGETMTTYVCPFCHKDLIFTYKREFETFWNDCGALFFSCGCGKNIVSEAFKKRDGTPKIFYDNKWKLCPDGTWFYLAVEHDRMTMWKNMSKPRQQIPKKKLFLFR